MLLLICLVLGNGTGDCGDGEKILPIYYNYKM
jgi:hypothetical protein